VAPTEEPNEKFDLAECTRKSTEHEGKTIRKYFQFIIIIRHVETGGFCNSAVQNNIILLYASSLQYIIIRINRNQQASLSQRLDLITNRIIQGTYLILLLSFHSISWIVITVNMILLRRYKI